MKIVATIEARMTSTRLPGKVLLPANGKPMIEHIINRLRRVPSLDAIVLATTTNAADDPLVAHTAALGIASWRGSEDDVMQRVHDAAASVQADLVVEILGDCPLVDPELIEQIIQMYHHNPCDYASNCMIRCYPRGMDIQVFSAAAFARSLQLTDDPLNHEHVSLHIRNHPELFRHIHLMPPPSLLWPDLALTLDTMEDYLLLKKIFTHFGDTIPRCQDIVDWLRRQPHLLQMNAHIKRKGDA